jgi:hypothetical protein
MFSCVAFFRGRALLFPSVATHEIRSASRLHPVHYSSRKNTRVSRYSGGCLDAGEDERLPTAERKKLFKKINSY